MPTIIFDREKLSFVGMDREKLPFEVEIRDVNVDTLYKEIELPIKREKVNEEGEPLYVYPQEPLVFEETYPEFVETVFNTGIPVIIQKEKTVPVLDESGKQITYRRTQEVEVTKDTGRPIMVTQVVDGETVEVQKTNQNGDKLFWETVEFGEPVPCTTVQTVTVQKRNELLQPLFYEEQEMKRTVTQEQPNLEITEDDDLYIEGLPRALEDATTKSAISFAANPEMFSYDDILKHKESLLLKSTFYKESILYETMDEVFDIETATGADVGFDYVSIAPNGEIVTDLILLPCESDYVAVMREESLKDTLQVSVSVDGEEFIPTDAAREAIFSENATTVQVKFKNPTAGRIDLMAFALLV